MKISMFKIDFYEKNGESQVFEFLEDLRKRKDTNKDARVQFSQAAYQIQLLSDNGTKSLPAAIAEHLEDGIWELRPGNNRVFFFFYEDDGSYVLLHQIRKKSQKTPPREIMRAKKERKDYLLQKNDAREKEDKKKGK